MLETGLAEAVLSDEPEPEVPEACTAIVIDLPGGGRVSIAASTPTGACSGGVEGVPMISSGVRVWIAMGHTDMRRGMQGLALMVQQHLSGDPFAGDLSAFRGRTESLIKIVWHDGIGMWLYARLEKGRFVWPQAKDAWSP
jgi:transposase